jgi:hypothetical protein
MRVGDMQRFISTKTKPILMILAFIESIALALTDCGDVNVEESAPIGCIKKIGRVTISQITEWHGP